MKGVGKIYRAVWRDNLRCLPGIRRMDRVPNARIRELCVSDERIDVSGLRFLSHVERREK